MCTVLYPYYYYKHDRGTSSSRLPVGLLLCLVIRSGTHYRTVCSTNSFRRLLKTVWIVLGHSAPSAWIATTCCRNCHLRYIASRSVLQSSFAELMCRTSLQAQQFQWMKETYPTLYQQMKQYIAEGRFIPVGGTWVEMVWWRLYYAALLWPRYGIGQSIMFLPCGFFLSSFFSSPNLSSRRLDVYHTSTHGVALVRI